MIRQPLSGRQPRTDHPNFIPDDISEIGSASLQPVVRSPAPTEPHRYGAFHVKYLLYFFIPILIASCLYSYHEAVKKKEERPYPHATITNTACHFSQDITFRYIQLSASSFLHLLYFLAFNWIKMIVRRTGYPGSDLGWLYPISFISVFGVFAALGTIDGGGTGWIHTIGAVFFFIMLYVLNLNITLTVRDIAKWDPTSISPNSILQKSIVCLALTLVIIYSLIGLVFEAFKNDDDAYIVIMEWNLVIVGLGWMLTFSSDWKRVFLTLKGDFSQTVTRINP